MKKKILGLFFLVLITSFHAFGMQVSMPSSDLDRALFKLVDEFMKPDGGDTKSFEQELKGLLTQGADINAKIKPGKDSAQPLLCYVILYLFKDPSRYKGFIKDRDELKERCLSLLKILDSNGADICEATTAQGMTPLHLAVSVPSFGDSSSLLKGDADLVRFLFESKSYKTSGGKALTMKNKKGLIPEDYFIKEMYNPACKNFEKIVGEAKKVQGSTQGKNNTGLSDRAIKQKIRELLKKEYEASGKHGGVDEEKIVEQLMKEEASQQSDGNLIRKKFESKYHAIARLFFAAQLDLRLVKKDGEKDQEQ